MHKNFPKQSANNIKQYNNNNMITRKLHYNSISILLLSCILLSTIPSIVVVQATENHYCGTNWMAAATSCSNPCPSTLDSDCTTPGETCFGYTGCVKPRPPPTTSPTISPIVITSKPTQKPKRTKKTTVSPTKFISLAPTTTISPTVTPPTMSPVGSPSFSPIPRPLLIDLSNNGGLSTKDVENRDDLQLSYGIIFDLMTTKNSGVVQIQSLEFYIIPNLDELKSQAMMNNSTNSTTASESDNNNSKEEEEYKIQYEIYTKVGTWHGFEGRERSFTQVSSGSITVLPEQQGDDGRDIEKRRRLQGGFATGFGVGSSSSSSSTTGEESELTIPSKGGLIRIPPSKFTPININGDETRQSIYITLSSRSLLYSRSSTSSSSSVQSITSISQINSNSKESKGDTIPLISEEELTIYTGASIMIYPYNKANQRIYYKKPREFVGRLWYHRKPCLDIVVDEEDSMEEENIFQESSLTEEEIEVDDIGIEDEDPDRGRKDRRRERELGNVINWKNCIENTENVELPPLEDMPSFFLPSSSSTTSSQQTNIALPNNNGTIPTTVPTTSTQPTITTSKVNLIITLHNVQASTIDLATGKQVYRTLNNPEQDEFEMITLELYDEKEILDMNEIELYGCNVYYQQILEPPSLNYGINDEEEESSGGSRKSRNRLRRNLQSPPDTIPIAESYEGRGNTSRPEDEFNLPLNTTTFVDPNNSTVDKDTPQFIDPNAVVPTEPPIAPPPTPPPTNEFIPTSTSLEITLVISILYTTLPQQITSELLQTIFLQNKDEYMILLKENPILSNYFNTLDEIPSVITVDTITQPPTLQPSNVPTVYVMTNSDVIKEPLSTSMTIGIIIALLYTVLACCSMLYVKRARQLMRIERSKRMIANSGVGGAGGSATAFIGHDMFYEEERKDTVVSSKRRSSIRRGSSFMKSIVGGRRRSSKLSIDSDEMIGLNSSGVPLTESDSHDDDDNDEDESFEEEEESEAEVSSMAESEYSE